MCAKKIKTLLPRYMRINDTKRNGVIYTPEWIVNLILDKIEYNKNPLDKKIIDPACGDGNFLIIVLDRLFNYSIDNKLTIEEIKEQLNNIYGFEIDSNSVKQCKDNLTEVAKSYNIEYTNWNIFNIDSLNKAEVNKYFKKFDYVIGNPPYIRIQHLGEKRRKKIQKEWMFCKSGSTDIYIAFFELATKLLKSNGKLGYITPNTFFRTNTAYNLRGMLTNRRCIKEIIDFGYHQIFDNATTYSAITILDKNWDKNEFSYYNFDNDTNKINFVDIIKLSTLNNKQWVLASNKDLKRIKEIENRGERLGKIAKIHVGVTTLADDFYIFKNPIFEDDKAIIKLKDDREFIIEKSILKPIIKASILKSADEIQNRYIIFPYKKINGYNQIIEETELEEKYPYTYKYFLAIKERLSLRDKGKQNYITWYAFGRSQGLDTSFGKKILFPPLSLKPNFIIWEKEEYTFYAGYCIKFEGDLTCLAEQLNSSDMTFYINYIGRDYRNGYKAYAKNFIKNFGIVNLGK